LLHIRNSYVGNVYRKETIFEDGQNLHTFEKNSFPNNILQILDPSLMAKPGQATIEEENTQNLTRE